MNIHHVVIRDDIMVISFYSFEFLAGFEHPYENAIHRKKS